MESLFVRMKYYLLIFGTLFLLVSCSWNSDENTTSENTPITIEKAEIHTYQTSLSSLPDPVEKDSNFVSCMNQSTNMCISSAVMTIAQDSKDIKLCNDLHDEAIKASCRQTIITLNAREKKDEKLCKDLDAGSIAACKGEIVTLKAVDARSTKLCTTVSEFYADSKSSQADKDRWEIAESSCIIQVVNRLDSPDIALCNSISEKNQKDMCTRIVNNRLATTR
jgi:hypothetical protein